MDNKKICFIMCANNERYVQEALYYIDKLNIPDGYSVDCITVMDAKSMTGGYNEAMLATDAKYKIYMHQDVYIIENNFIRKILEIFKNEAIGMIGMVGACRLPENAIMWYGERIGKIYSCSISGAGETFMGDVDGSYSEVQAIDGLLMATQYDVPWREDIFDGWDFYDISQSYEFRRAGYKVVVPYMEHPWCMHDDDLINLRSYYKYRRKFIEEYGNDR